MSAAQEIARRRLRTQLYRYRPYPKQYFFHAAGASYRERLLLAANQVGKTYSAANEVAYHLTGDYPEWWCGRVFEKPPLGWTGTKTWEESREVIQAALLGTEEASRKAPTFGQGSLPYDSIVDITKRQAGVVDVVDQIFVKHKSGGVSRIVLKTFIQGRELWQGKAVDFVWLDEECPEDIHSEAVIRTNTTNGIIMDTYTPLNGMTGVTERYLSPEPGAAPSSVTNMVLEDAVNGIWPADTPWEGEYWEGHYTEDQVKDIIARVPAHERDARTKGIPMLGSGRVFPIPEETIKVADFAIPRHWVRGGGLDFGMDHPFAHVNCAWDREQDVFYVLGGYKAAGHTTAYHSIAVKAADPQDFIPIFWPHDGMERGKSSAQPLYKAFKKEYVHMWRESSRYEDKIGGPQPVEPALVDMLERMLTGRFRVFASFAPWFEEFRTYHRKDGQLVKLKDDLMSATRAAYIMRRKFALWMPKQMAHSQIQRPLIGQRPAA